MPKRNRDVLMAQCLYDMLVSMNDQLDKNTHCACIMECFMLTQDAERRCQNHSYKCNECVAEWLNEFPF